MATVDRFGLAGAYQAYQTTYDGLKKEYESKFPRYDRACNRINALKEIWARTIQVCDQTQTVQNMSVEDRKKKQNHVLRAQHDMQQVLNKTKKLLDDLHEGRAFLEHAPVPNFGMKRDTQWLEKATQELTEMETQASVLHESMKRRIDLTNHEGRVLCDRYEGIARSWFGDQLCYLTGAGHYATHFDELAKVENPEHILTESDTEASDFSGFGATVRPPSDMQDFPLSTSDNDDGRVDEVCDQNDGKIDAALISDVDKAQKDHETIACAAQHIDANYTPPQDFAPSDMFAVPIPSAEASLDGVSPPPFYAPEIRMDSESGLSPGISPTLNPDSVPNELRYSRFLDEPPLEQTPTSAALSNAPFFFQGEEMSNLGRQTDPSVLPLTPSLGSVSSNAMQVDSVPMSPFCLNEETPAQQPAQAQRIQCAETKPQR